jgi:hypothetical protein
MLFGNATLKVQSHITVPNYPDLCVQGHFGRGLPKATVFSKMEVLKIPERNKTVLCCF